MARPRPLQNPYRPARRRPVTTLLCIVAAFCLGLFCTSRFTGPGLVKDSLLERGLLPRALSSASGSRETAAAHVRGQALAQAQEKLKAQAQALVRAELQVKEAQAAARAAIAEAASARRRPSIAGAQAKATNVHRQASTADALGVDPGASAGQDAKAPVAGRASPQVLVPPPLVSIDRANGPAWAKSWPYGLTAEAWRAHMAGHGVMYILTGCCSRFCDWQAVVGVHSVVQTLKRTRTRDQSIIRFAACDIWPGRSLGKAASFGRTEVFSHGADNLPNQPGFYPPLSKSRCLARWVESSEEAQQLPDDLNIALMDEDFLMLEPLQPHARPGRPVAQDWNEAFRNGAVASAWLQTPIKRHCRGHCDGMTPAQARLHEAGPPYMMTLGDLRKMAPLWHELTVALLRDDEARKACAWLVDMYSYVLASIILGFKHTLRTDLQTTFPGTYHEWNGPNGFNRMSERPVAYRYPRPAFLHYCQPYEVKVRVAGAEQVLKLYKHQLHQRGNENAAGLLSCDEQHSTSTLIASMLSVDGGDAAQTDALEALPASVRMGLPRALRQLVRHAPKYQEALKNTIDRDGAEAMKKRTVWMFANLYDGMTSAFAEYRKRLCEEPMPGF